ncbi:MAG: signal peptide peptidase SppA [Alphaproteobacteria bacterium]
MIFEADLLADRRRLRRRVAWWRAAAILIAVGAVVAAIESYVRPVTGDRLARLNVDGIIVSDPERDAALAALGDDDDIRALVVRIDSPGGTFGGGETLYESLRAVAAKKPVVAVMGDVATSAAYMTAIATDRIFAHRGTITGSIGVIWQTVDVSGLLAELGITTEALRSGPLKARPTPLEPLTEPVRAVVQHLVDDMYDLFVDMVMTRRALDEPTVRRLADGRVYSGREALGIRLIDAIGGEVEARAWLADEHGVAEDLPITDLTWGEDDADMFRDILGLSGKTLLPETLILDGLVSVWHP